MELILWVVGVLVGLALVAEVLKSINWIKFVSFFVIGGVALAVLFSYTSEGVMVIIGAYAVLLVISIFFGAFKNMVKEN